MKTKQGYGSIKSQRVPTFFLSFQGANATYFSLSGLTSALAR